MTGNKIAWDFRIPIATNVFLWYDLAKTWIIAYAVTVALMSSVFVLSGDPQSVMDMVRIFAVVFSGLAVVSVPLAVGWYANRVTVRFTLSPEGVQYETLERKDRVLNRVLIGLALLLGRPGAAGTGLIAAGREKEFTKWRDVNRLKEHPSWSVITLMNGWRVVQRLYCVPERYEEVARYVREHSGTRGPRHRPAVGP